MKLATIEEKLVDAINSPNKGITKDEVEKLLARVVQNTREHFIDHNNKPLKDASLLGFCGFGQGITAVTLQNMGLTPKILNINPTFSNEAGRHDFLAVEFPIRQENGEVKGMPYLVDTTYRQFFLRNEITTTCGQYIKDKRFGNRVAPLAGYWVLQMPRGQEFAEAILSKGFMELTEENAKMYGDSFVLEETKRKDYTKVPTKKELITGVSGKTYIHNMLNPLQEEEIDFYEGEIEEKGFKVKTPRMIKRELNISATEHRSDESAHTILNGELSHDEL